MKRLLTLFILITSIVSLSHSQTATTPEVQSVKPVRNAMVERKVVAIDVDGVTYENVNVSMQAVNHRYYNRNKVKIVIRDVMGKKLWSKTFSDVFLYVFSDGQVQVGQGTFIQLLIEKIAKPTAEGEFKATFREKQGIF